MVMARALILAVLLLVHLSQHELSSVSAARVVPAVVSHAGSNVAPGRPKVERRLAGDQEETVQAAPVREVSRCRAHLQLICVCFSQMLRLFLSVRRPVT